MYNAILIDDDEWSLKVSKKMFHWEEYGIDVILSTTDQITALDCLDTNKVDVILLDMSMPGLSGEEMLREIRKRNKKAKIIILSGYSIFQYAQKAIDYNVFTYCVKPISEEKAQEVMNRLKKELDEGNPYLENEIMHRSEIENPRFDKLVKYINNHYDEKLYLNELVDKFGINMTYCCYLFKKHFNMGFVEYVTDIKMKKAADMLINTNKEIDEIADSLNYEYVYFCKIFKKYFGKTPRNFRATSMNKR